MPTRRDCLSAVAALGALALAPAFARSAAAAGAPAAARAYLVGGWVLTAADLARLGADAPPAIPLPG